VRQNSGKREKDAFGQDDKIRRRKAFKSVINPAKHSLRVHAPVIVKTTFVDDVSPPLNHLSITSANLCCFSMKRFSPGLIIMTLLQNTLTPSGIYDALGHRIENQSYLKVPLWRQLRAFQECVRSIHNIQSVFSK